MEDIDRQIEALQEARRELERKLNHANALLSKLKEEKRIKLNQTSTEHFKVIESFQLYAIGKVIIVQILSSCYVRHGTEISSKFGIITVNDLTNDEEDENMYEIEISKGERIKINYKGNLVQEGDVLTILRY